MRDVGVDVKGAVIRRTKRITVHQELYFRFLSNNAILNFARKIGFNISSRFTVLASSREI